MFSFLLPAVRPNSPYLVPVNNNLAGGMRLMAPPCGPIASRGADWNGHMKSDPKPVNPFSNCC